MALDPKDAMDRAKALLRDSANVRAHWDAFWAMEMVYDTGEQWGYVSEKGGNLGLNQLKRIIDPNRPDVRVTMNRVHQDVNKITSVLSPQRVNGTVQGTGGTSAYSRSCDRLMEKLLPRIRAMEEFRQMCPIRTVLGSSFIKRTIQAVGGSPGAGAPRAYRIGLTAGYPWEIVRDPSAKTLDPGKDEEIVCHEKPRTVAWVKRNFGFTPETSTELGKLLTYQDQLMMAQGAADGRYSTESREKAVMWREFYFQDPDSPGNWPWVMVAWSDPAKGRTELKVVPNMGKSGISANPHRGLPITFFHFDRIIDSPWSRGVPHLLMEGQDLFNIAWTWLARAMSMGIGKWVAEKDRIETPSKMLNNNPRVPLYYTRPPGAQQVTPPQFIAHPPVPTTIPEIIGSVPTVMRDALNMAEVQYGLAPGRRGEAGKSYEIRLSQAGSVIEDVRTWDELAYQEVLYGLLVDTITHSTVDQLAELLGPDSPRAAAYALKRAEDPAKEIVAVRLHPSTVRPRTQVELEDRFTTLAVQRILTPDEAKTEMYLQGGFSIDTGLERAFDKQQAEIERILAGDWVPPGVGENHPRHIAYCRLILDSRQAEDFTPDQDGMVRKHMIGHMETMAAEAQLAQQIAMGGQVQQQPGQPSPPSEAFNQPPAGQGAMAGSTGAGFAP